jgi:glycosyltransferase involved in cell wall biosynthesis
MNPKVSVITTVYQDLGGLLKTSISVLKQTYPVEWIVIDADTGPEMVAFLKSIESRSHEFSWLSEKDLGLYDGMNKGFSRANGDLILFLNAGDILVFDDTIQRVVDSYLDFEWSWAVGLATRVTEDGTPHAIWEYLNHSLGGLALGTRTFCHQACFYEREFLQRLLPYEIKNLASDHLLNIRAYKRKTPHTLPFVTTLFVDGGVSSKRPLNAAFRDLHKIRRQEDLLILNSKLVDLLVTKLVVLLVKIGGACWKLMRLVGHRLIQEPKRYSP